MIPGKGWKWWHWSSFLHCVASKFPSINEKTEHSWNHRNSFEGKGSYTCQVWMSRTSVLRKHEQRSLVRDDTIYIYTDMNVYQYLIMLLCDSQLHLTRSSPFETIEYCAPTSLRRLVPFPPFPTLGEQAHWHHPKASLSSPKWARVEALIKQAMWLVTEYIKSKKDINVCWGRTSLCHLRQVILSSDNTDNSGARSFK